MLLKMTEEPDDYEGPWPEGDAMLTIENRAGIDVLVMNKGAQPATEGEVALFAEVVRLRAYIANLAAAPAAPQMTDAEMDDAIKHDEAEQERAHVAYLRGIEEGKRQATTPQDRSAPARRNDMAAFATELKADPAKAQAFFQSAGIIDERGELMPEYAAPQQAEPVAQIGWADEFGNLFPMGAWKPTQRTHHDSHKTAWRPVFLHPHADEVQRLRDALEQIEHEANQPYIQRIARRALEGE